MEITKTHIFLLFFSLYVTYSFKDLEYDNFTSILKQYKDLPSNDSELKIMSFNIRDPYMDKNTDNKWENRRIKVVKLIKSFNPDIVGVQEDTDEMREELTKALPEYDYIHSGNGILYKKSLFVLEDKNKLYLSETPYIVSKSWSKTIRTFSFLKLKHIPSDKTFIAVNAHLDHEVKDARVKGTKLILEKLKEYNTQNLDIIMTGDFNEAANLSVHSLYKSENFNDSFETCLVNNCSPNSHLSMTFHNYYGNLVNGYLPRPILYFLFAFHGKGLPSINRFHIDWILYKSTTISPKLFLILNDYDQTGIFPSDHFPIMAVFKLK